MLNLMESANGIIESINSGRTLKRRAIMDICFYDNKELVANEEGIVSVDRVYCLNFHEFIGATWEQLLQVYLALPQYVIKEHQCPMWFGEEGISSNYLYASVEPSGLQIVGELTIEQWEKWESVFHAQLSRFSFPSFEC